MHNIGLNKLFWLITTIFALCAALMGVINQDIYAEVVSEDVISGVLSQDIVTIFLAFVSIILIARMRPDNLKMQIIMLGVMGTFFYSYGIYAIERIYTPLYFVYLAIFGLSFYSIIYGISSFRKEAFLKISLPKAIRNVSVIFMLINPLFFYPLWIAALLPLIREGQRIEFTYSVFILDCCFVMPAFVILAFMTVKEKFLGLLLTPAMFIHGFTLLISVALGGVLKFCNNRIHDTSEIWLYLVLSIIFIILTVIYLIKLKIELRK